MVAKTIDNLGIDPSNVYARGKTLDETFLTGARDVSQRAMTLVTTPSHSEFSLLLGTMGNAPYALFTPPPRYTDRRRVIFGREGIPGKTPPDFQEAQLERISAMTDGEKFENEKSTITALLTSLGTVNKNLIDFYASRDHLKRG